jgi:hypothetical protein
VVDSQPPTARDPSSGKHFYDVRGPSVDEAKQKQLLKGPVPIRFDWENRWLRGDEYAHIIANMEAYSSTFQMAHFEEKTHPACIYTAPESKVVACLTLV